MDPDDIPDMSTPARSVSLKRPAFPADTPKRAPKRQDVGDKKEVGVGSLDKENVGVAEPPPPSTMAAFQEMQGRHLTTDLGDDTTTIAGSSPVHPLRIDDDNDETLQLRSPGQRDASFFSAKSTLDQSPLSPPTCRALQTLHSSSIKPVFKMRPSLGKLTWQSSFLSGTRALRTSSTPCTPRTPKPASPFRPEKFRSLAPLWYEDVEIDFDVEMRDASALSLALPPKPPAVTATATATGDFSLSPQHQFPPQHPLPPKPLLPSQQLARAVNNADPELSSTARDRFISLGIFKPCEPLHVEAPAPIHVPLAPSAPAPASLPPLPPVTSGKSNALDSLASQAQLSIASSVNERLYKLTQIQERQNESSKLLKEVKLKLAHLEETQTKQQNELSALKSSIQKWQDQGRQQQAQVSTGGSRKVSNHQNDRESSHSGEGWHRRRRRRNAKSGRDEHGCDRRQYHRKRSPTPEVKQENPFSRASTDGYF